MKTTMKKVLCLLLTCCMALSCAVISVHAQDAGPAVKTEVPVYVVEAAVENREGHTAYQISVLVSCELPEECKGTPLADVLRAPNIGAKVPVESRLFYAIPASAGSAEVVSARAIGHYYYLVFSLSAEDGTPGLPFPQIGNFRDPDWNENGNVNEQAFMLTLHLPEGFFAGDAYYSAACDGTPRMDYEETYELYYVPEWFENLLIAADNSSFLAQKFPKLAQFLQENVWDNLAMITEWLSVVADMDVQNAGQAAGFLLLVLPLAGLFMPVGIRMLVVIQQAVREAYGVSLPEFVVAHLK